MTALVRGVALGVTPASPDHLPELDTDPRVCAEARADGYAPTCGQLASEHHNDCPEENPVSTVNLPSKPPAGEVYRSPDGKLTAVCLGTDRYLRWKLIGPADPLVNNGWRADDHVIDEGWQRMGSVFDLPTSACGVSSEADTTTPEPRVWRDETGSLWRDAEPEPLVVLIECDGSPTKNPTPVPRSGVERAWGPLSTVSAGDHTGGAA